MLFRPQFWLPAGYRLTFCGIFWFIIKAPLIYSQYVFPLRFGFIDTFSIWACSSNCWWVQSCWQCSCKLLLNHWDYRSPRWALSTYRPTCSFIWGFSRTTFIFRCPCTAAVLYFILIPSSSISTLSEPTPVLLLFSLTTNLTEVYYWWFHSLHLLSFVSS